MRIIDADALINWLKKPTGFVTNCEDCVEIDCLDCIIDEAIKNAPTIDAEPVRHGTWETILYEQRGRINSYAHACPECKYVYKDFKPIGHNFCPKCGTIMDGGGGNEG